MDRRKLIILNKMKEDSISYLYHNLLSQLHRSPREYVTLTKLRVPAGCNCAVIAESYVPPYRTMERQRHEIYR